MTHAGSESHHHMLHVCTPVTIRVLCSCLSQASLVARNLPFAPDLNTLAEEIIDGMKRVGVVVYNGIHLRIEKDAKEWAEIMGGEKVNKAPPSSMILCPFSQSRSMSEAGQATCSLKKTGLSSAFNLLKDY